MTAPTPGVTTAPIFGGDAPAAVAAPVREYEFSTDDNAVFRGVAAAMRFVALGNAVLGAVLLLSALAGMYLSGRAGLLPGVAQALAAGIAAVNVLWLRTAAVEVDAIATTQGSDITHLMHAMRALRQLFTLQRTLLLAAAVLAVPAALVAGFLLFKSAPPG